ncbi:MAG: PorP/SprF family type IX secretion system membrane protein [Bacteroidales bacterium]|nr:PorP/SprF family type IX secretion system membrane protein [Bacteroidales bacterium]
MKKILHTILFSLAFLPFLLNGQDPQFSQFYSNSLYLAPSFAGLTGLNRVAFNYRQQWPQIPNGFETYSFAFDRYFEKFNSGLGVLILKDQAGSGHLRSTNIGLQYSFDFRILNKWHVRPGMHFLYTERGIDFDELLWNDQISASGNSPTSGEVPSIEDVGDIDFSVSVMGYSDLFWFGFSIDHLLHPNQSLYDYEFEEGNRGYIPVKYSVFGGTKFVKNEELLQPIPSSIQIAFLYKQQEQFRQLDLGMYLYKNPLVLGFWYRGIPLYKSVFNRDAFTILTGYKIKNLNIGYSYDFTISKLIANTGGSHEISFSYTFKTKKLKRKPRMVPCPEF